jgi:hypothetical protein
MRDIGADVVEANVALMVEEEDTFVTAAAVLLFVKSFFKFLISSAFVEAEALASESITDIGADVEVEDCGLPLASSLCGVLFANFFFWAAVSFFGSVVFLGTLDDLPGGSYRATGAVVRPVEGLGL